MNTDLAQRFRGFPLFRKMTDDQVAEFVADCEPFECEEGEVFIHQGREGDHVYFVSEGKMRVFLVDDDGKEHRLAILKAPAVVGEIEFLTREPRSASVRAAAPLRGVSMDFKKLNERLKEGNPTTFQVFFYVSRVLARRLSRMNNKLAEVEKKAPGTRIDELRDFQKKLMTEWSV